ncbi:hypothetical protein B0I35DRAFT_459440 [Stachybotrys elegans]|uniref:Uncharacterized protein n=1 Tax=Stachybotrys elegans TaxID=80388 RepID=A0A8K0STK3_9HYPO|nr:hypothetical protein B0I35DRAFT_459440 [Stachybotrys elegans]
MSLPSAPCFSHDVYRDHWSLYTRQYREASPQPSAQLSIADAMNNATLFACRSEALGEDELTDYFVSYGTAVAQAYAGLFPSRVGRMVLDGNVYSKDCRQIGQNWRNSLINVTDVRRDGFLGECIRAGPDHCALAQPQQDGHPVTLHQLQGRMETLIQSLIANPIPAYLESTGPMLISCSEFVQVLYPSLYLPTSWSATARMLQELEAGNSAAAAERLKSLQAKPSGTSATPFAAELTSLVICADAHDSLDSAVDLAWWDDLWSEYTTQPWLTGNYGFYVAFPCRHFKSYWESLETWHGDLNSTLRNPLLLLSSTYDPSTPLRNSGHENKKYINLDATAQGANASQINAQDLITTAIQSYQKLQKKRSIFATTLIEICHSLSRFSKSKFYNGHPSPGQVLLTFLSLPMEISEDEEHASIIATEGIMEILRHVGRWGQASEIAKTLSSLVKWRKFDDKLNRVRAASSLVDKEVQTRCLESLDKINMNQHDIMNKIDGFIARVQDLTDNTIHIKDHVSSTESNVSIIRDTVAGNSLRHAPWTLPTLLAKGLFDQVQNSLTTYLLMEGIAAFAQGTIRSAQVLIRVASTGD